MTSIRIKVRNSDDRANMARILLDNGNTVRVDRIKTSDDTRLIPTYDYWIVVTGNEDTMVISDILLGDKDE